MMNVIPVLIVGGGPVGLTLAALLGQHGIRTLVIEADPGYCTGSRAICLSRRSLEIMGWLQADWPLVHKGLPWSGGRSFFRDTEVLHFRMPSEPAQRFAPMINIQQYYVEEIAHHAAQGQDDLVQIRWSSKVIDVQQYVDYVEAIVEAPDGSRSTVHANWLVACDGGRSTVRELSGLAFEGIQYEGRYVIVDIDQATQRSVERLAWFDPPSNPGSTILMHRQPDNIWRIDYQIADDEDALEAVKPENVLPRVSSHLKMIGETAPWKPLWISIYNAKCLTLANYRHHHVLFAGDAAHLVPIFGVRGLNSGLDDAANLAWKLALVLQHGSSVELLDSYSSERVHAARQNIAYGAKSTEFMAPPHAGFALMRQAALRLAADGDAAVRPLINPRQSAPISYPTSPLNAASSDSGHGPIAGDPAPEARLGDMHLTQLFGRGFVVLLFSDTVQETTAPETDAGNNLLALTTWRIGRQRPGNDHHSLFDDAGQAWERYMADEGTMVVIRPDGYILARWARPNRQLLDEAMACFGAVQAPQAGSTVASQR
jgi:3-(3-hydroxy-phenyl)propionate hydroxylase